MLLTAARTRLAINGRFLTLLRRLTLSGPEQITLRQHELSIRSRLKNTFATNKVERIGSQTRGSSIPHTSDVDLLLVLRREEVKWGDRVVNSSTILNRVRDSLQARYNRTEVGRDVQAVVTQFNDGQHPVDVVPAYFAGPGVWNYPLYAIPDGEDGWRLTSPQAHAKYLINADAASGGKLKNVAKLLKYWSVCRSTGFLNGFHAELLLASEKICVGPKSYSSCIFEALQNLDQRSCRALQDPLRISGLIPAAGTESKRELLATAVSNSLVHASRAMMAIAQGNTQEAIHQWDIVFNSWYPK